MEIIIHAGLPKTGSSALQDYMAGCRDQLRAANIIYPAFDDHKSHWKLAALLHQDPENFHHIRRRAPDKDVNSITSETKQRLLQILDATSPSDTVIFSHEGISNQNTANGLAEFRDLLLTYTEEVHVVAYARSPLELYTSSVQQRLKSLDSNLTPPSKWVSSHGDRAKLLVDVFGTERCSIRIYSQFTLLRQDVITDFADCLFQSVGKHMPVPTEPHRSNTSLSAPACAILMAVRRGIIGDVIRKDYAKLRGVLGEFKSAQATAKLAIPEDWRTVIAAQNFQNWNRLVDLTRYEEEVKSTMLFPRTLSEKPVKREALESWIMSYGSADFTSEFIEFCRGKARLPKGRLATIAQKLERVVTHFATTCSDRASS